MDELSPLPQKVIPGEELHLTILMAPHSLNLVVGEDRKALLAYARDVWNAALAARDDAQGDQVADVAIALEQQRALKIVADVAALRSDKDMTEAFDAGFVTACDEIEHRLRTERWALGGVDSPPLDNLTPLPKPSLQRVSWFSPLGSWSQFHDDESPLPDHWDDEPPDEIVPFFDAQSIRDHERAACADRDAKIVHLREALQGVYDAYCDAMKSEFDYPNDPWTPERDNDRAALAARAALEGKP